MDEFKMDEIEIDEMEFDGMEFDEEGQDNMELVEKPRRDKNCCVEKKEKIEPCDDLIVKTKEITVNLENCSGRLLLVPVTLEKVCKKIPVNVAVIVCKKWKVIGMVVKQLVARKHSHPHSPCVKIEETFCIPIDTDVCKKTLLDIKVIAAYATGEKCPDDCDCDRRCDCDCESE